MSIRVSRRNFLKLSATGVATSSMAMLGFAPEPAMASIRYFKLAAAKVTRNTCTYCSVGCGMLIYSRGDNSINTVEDIYHIEGDPDHPVSRGSLCPRGAGALDFVKSESRLSHPSVREPGSNEWKRISWNEALDRIARHLKDDRDKNFVTRDQHGHLVNHWTTTGFLAASATSNETAYLTQKIARSLGVVVMDNQARV
ncbi:twin-arginine translocation signal domain-containing protein [Pseudomonas luteola]|jgi:formate dehydrogenase major subunit|uniref:Formate dehydrogenase major subunit n=1 Tax=Pseudomonas lutea TaxID=243924 RepID=A0A9X8ME19_9PSED|nr:tat (twin-arginine translocation) pathway signal sequence [Pseudomonas sp. HPB0071]RRW41275.1 twin-arginine translocation signal domain-containing protein [Pseudomonas luteola]RRW44862.1 twin-arginine translocation signal domain-containing protein [Pseudomonas luteola]SEQ78661.1 formate dehydrogenase major subunit [Pseudomonas lutea]SHJ65873.1 formate dehydrogenase major subunit [Pseudomonas zeshuii]